MYKWPLSDQLQPEIPVLIDIKSFVEFTIQSSGLTKENRINGKNIITQKAYSVKWGIVHIKFITSGTNEAYPGVTGWRLGMGNKCISQARKMTFEKEIIIIQKDQQVAFGRGEANISRGRARKAFPNGYQSNLGMAMSLWKIWMILA